MAEPGVPAPSQPPALATTSDVPVGGGKFSITNGSVVGGPAPSPLTAVSIKVHGTSIARHER